MSPEEIAALLATVPDGPEAEELRRQLQKEKTAEEDRIRREHNAMLQAEYDRRVKAIIETGMAYYRRGEWQQYDSVNLTYAGSRHGNPGSRRTTDHISPEDSTGDLVKYMVCSSFIYNVYYEAIGWKLGDEPNTCICKYHYEFNDGSIVYRWNENDGETVEEAIENIRRILRPGDIFTSGKKTEHTVLYVGDVLGDGVNYVLHAWGGKYKMETGKENHEAKGTVRLQPIEQLCFAEGDKQWYRENKIPRWSMYDGIYRAAIIRPLRPWREETYPLTANAQARLAHPGLHIVRTANVNPYKTIPMGSVITYTVRVENQSKENYDEIVINEQIPQNTNLEQATGAVREGDTLRWSVNIPAGGAAEVTWSVKVISGDCVVSKDGDVAGIRSNCIVTHVANVLPEASEKSLLTLTAENVDVAEVGTAFCNAIYKRYLGLDVQLPQEKELLQQLICTFTREDVDDPCVCFRDEMSETMDKIRIPNYWGGRQLIIPTEKRILEFEAKYLMPGDILVYSKEPLESCADCRVYLYLGEERFLISTESGVTECGKEILWPAFTEDFFIALRPAHII